LRFLDGFGLEGCGLERFLSDTADSNSVNISAADTPRVTKDSNVFWLVGAITSDLKSLILIPSNRKVKGNSSANILLAAA